MHNMRPFVEVNTRALDKSPIYASIYCIRASMRVQLTCLVCHAADPDMPNMHPFAEATTKPSAGLFWSKSKHSTLVWDR